MPRTILIADNNAFYRQVLQDFFRAEGYETALVSDGVEALEKITEGGIDVVLLDLIMPRIDGARLARFMKAHPTLRSIPIVILSGILADEIEGFESIGADAYVAKMPLENLKSVLRRVFADLSAGRSQPVIEGFDNMYRREVVLELLEERRAREIIQNALTEGLVELSDDRRVLKTNRAFELMLGRTGSELLSVRIEDLFDESREAISALFEGLERSGGDLAGGVVPRQGRAFRLRVHPLADRDAARSVMHPKLLKIAEQNPKVRILQPGKLPAFILLIEDVTDQIRTQQERDLFREKMARSEKMSALGLFVAGTAHELNNPLTAVLGYAQLLAGKNFPPDVKAGLGKIEAGAVRCRAIVENLLVFAHRGQTERRRHEVRALVDQAVEECTSKEQAACVEVLVESAGAVPPVEAGAAEMIQAIAAVVDNAIHAAAEAAGPAQVRVRVVHDSGYGVIEVTDSGPGIPAGIRDRIFDPFFTTLDVGQGKGLGLSVAYGIVRAHSGSITAGDAPGGGAAVTIRIPCARVAESRDARSDAQVPAARTADRGARILVVDDEPVVLDLISDALGSSHRIETAANGREGLIKAGKESFDLILLDMKMPDMTGRQMYEALAALRPDMADRVVFTTGDTVQENTRRFLDSLSNPCLSKPFSLDALGEIVDRMLAASRTA